LKKLDKLSNDALKKSHWMPVDFARRWEQYELHNSIENFVKGAQGEAKYPLIRFF